MCSYHPRLLSNEKDGSTYHNWVWSPVLIRHTRIIPQSVGCYECFQKFSKPLNGMSENFEMCNFSWTTCVVTNPGTLFHIWLIQHLFCLALPHRATNMAADPTACCFVFVHSGIMSAFRASDFPLVFMPLWTCCAFSVFSSNFAFFFPFIILRTRHVPASRLNLGSEMFAVWL